MPGCKVGGVLQSPFLHLLGSGPRERSRDCWSFQRGAGLGPVSVRVRCAGFLRTLSPSAVVALL